jgi:nucleoid-associated protein YgaU
MGNFEKLVVVVVLFLSAVVLAVSLRGGDEEGDPKSPLEAAGVATTPGEVNPLDAGPTAAELPASEAPPTTGFLLDAGASRGTTGAPAPTAEAAAPSALSPTSSPRILVTTDGLAPSALDDFMVYTPAEGDTWAALAQRFYGNAAYLSNLREANEGMGEALVPTDPILVPVYDFHAGSGTGAAPESDLASAGGAPAADAGASKRPVDAGGAPPPASGATVYEVKDGDNLSKISKVVYGTTTRWADIYAANRDKLESPDKLVVGMKLSIPAASATGAGATVAAHKPAEAPKTAKPAAAAASKPVEKKRKVQ